MPVSFGIFKAGRFALASCLGLVSLVAVAHSASAQTSGQREKLRTPTEKNFLNPGKVSSSHKGPGYVVDGLISSPGGRNDNFGGGLLPSALGGGQPLIGGRR